MNDDRKTLLFVVLSLIVLLFWMKTDPGAEEDDPDIVSIDYRCSLLNQYKYVPDEVVTECASRMNELESKKHPTKQNTSTTI